MEYPLVPKSTVNLRPGQFWAIPMDDGRFACGRILQLGGEENPTPTRAFFGGLHAWVGLNPPRAATSFGKIFVDVGMMHIRAVTNSGGHILGERDLVQDEIQLPELLSAHGGAGTMILSGAAHVRRARREEWGKMPVLRVWGYDVIVELANTKLARIAT